MYIVHDKQLAFSYVSPLPSSLSSGDYNDDGSDHDNGDDLLLIMMIYNAFQCFELSNFGEVSVSSA